MLAWQYNVYMAYSKLERSLGKGVLDVVFP